MEKMKQCPFCAEQIKSEATRCKHCHADLETESHRHKGEFIKVRLKALDKIYCANIFLPEYLNRVSDVLNDERKFIILTDTMQEKNNAEIYIGFLAINKNLVEWVRVIEQERESDHSGFNTRIIFS